MWWLWIVLGVVALAVVLMALVGSYFFKLTVVRGPRDKERTEEEMFQGDSPTWKPEHQKAKDCADWIRANGELIPLTAYDGLKLQGYFIDAEHAKGTIIAFHGYRSQATVDFAPEAPFFHEQGYRVILPYQRSHGKSDGEFITYGAKERYDARDWAKLAAARWPGEDIFLAGISMGCATVTMASDLELPGEVRGIIADCGFTSAWEEMAYLCKVQYHIPAGPILAVLNLFTKSKAGFGLKEGDSRVSLAKTKLPVLFIHGEADDFVPPYMTQQSYEACRSEKELLTVPGAAHAKSYVTDPETCQQRMKAFFDKHGTGKAGIRSWDHRPAEAGNSGRTGNTREEDSHGPGTYPQYD